jgi:hypothetical protein
LYTDHFRARPALSDLERWTLGWMPVLLEVSHQLHADAQLTAGLRREERVVHEGE